jgi:hypothetical protein
MDDKHDVYKAIKAQFPHARVDSIRVTTPAQCAHERTETRKRSEERKRQEGEFGNYMKSKPKHSIPMPDSYAWWLTILECEDAHPKGAKLRCNQPDFFTERWCEGCNKQIWQHAWYPDREHYVCRKCRLAMGLFHEWEMKEMKDYRRRIQSFTQKRFGGIEMQNENISGQMQRFGDKSYLERMRQTGQLQVRRDQNGNPCEYLVSSSRKQMASQIKDFNRHLKSRGINRELHHGGMTPD